MSQPNLADLLSGDGLSSLLQNPEVMAKLPKVMEALGPMLSQMQSAPKSEPTEGTESTETVHEDAVTVSAPPHAFRGIGSRHTALLRALEPYLSDERRAALSYILKVATLIDVVGEVL